MPNIRNMHARLKKLENPYTVNKEMCDFINERFNTALAEGRICSRDAPVVRDCLLRWVNKCN